MNILITGVSGFIGFSLARHLLKLDKNIKIYGVDSLNQYYSLKLKKKRTNILKKNKNFKFTSFDTALLKTFEWYKNHKDLL